VVRLFDEPFSLPQRVFFKYTDPVKGELFEPITIVPAQLAFCDPDLLVFPKDRQKELFVRKQLKTIQHIQENSVIHPALLSTVSKPAATVPSISITPVPGFDTRNVSVTADTYDFTLKSGSVQNGNAATWALVLKNGIKDTLLLCRTISYEHIPRIDYFKQAKTIIVSVNLQTRGNRIGYIEGAGDKVPDALTAMGFTVVKLNENSVTTENLQNLDAVIAGVRAYEVHDWLFGKYSILMDYIKNGGNLIVQYNRNLGDDSAGIGPYPFGISNARVTEEDAVVHFLQPDHPVLHFPNEISSNDFDGWIQERGIYFAQHLNANYQSIFSMHDSGEPDQTGSLITTNYGKGNFTYTGLVFFRELPAGVPGAYRLLANIIALNQHKDK